MLLSAIDGIDWSTLGDIADKYASYDINDLWSTRRAIENARYAIAAMLALQVYEWIHRYAFALIKLSWTGTRLKLGMNLA